MPPLEQGLLSPPMSPTPSSHLNKNKTLRGALGAIMPDLYFTGTTCAANNDGNGNNGMSASNTTGVEELTTVEEILHRLHIRFVYDEHRNDLVVNIVEGINLREKKSILILFMFNF